MPGSGDLSLKRPLVNLRLLFPAGLLAFLVLAGVGCQESEPNTLATVATEPTQTIAPAPVTAEATQTIAPTPIPGRNHTPTPSRPEANTPTVPAPPTNTPIPAPTATLGPTPEPDGDFDALYQLLASLEDNTRVGDILEVLAESEVACLQDEMNQTSYEYMARHPVLTFVTLPQFLTTGCIGTGREAEITVAVLAEAVGGLSMEVEVCIREGIIENNGDGSRSFYQPPSYLNCLNEEELLRLSVAEIAGQAGSVDSDRKGCLYQVMSAAFGAAEGLQSGNPQDSMAITFTFREAAIYGCLSNEQVAASMGASASHSTIDCIRHIYTQEFPRLYNDMGPKMFGSRLDLSTLEKEGIEAFRDKRTECQDNPAVHPTPAAPGPTLLPRIYSSSPSYETPDWLLSSMDANTSVGDLVTTSFKNSPSCLDIREMSRLSPEETEVFLASPAIVLTSYSRALVSCLGQRRTATLLAAIMSSTGIVNRDVQACLHQEFSQRDSSYFFHIRGIKDSKWPYDLAFIRCLTEGDFQNLAVAHLEAVSGKLPANGENCAREIASEGYRVAKSLDMERVFPIFEFHEIAQALCLTQEQLGAVYDPPAHDARYVWPPRDRECLRRKYDEMVERQRIVANPPGQFADGKDAMREFYYGTLSEFYADARQNC